MESGPGTWVVVALSFSMFSCVLALVAYWRSGGRDDLDVVRRKQQLVLDELSRRTRRGLEDSLARVTRAQQRLAELRTEAASNVHESMDGLSRELANIKRDTEVTLVKLKTEVTSGAQAAQESLGKRVRHIEGSIRILMARAEIRAAEELADAGRFVEAEDLLEDAVAKVREGRMRLADEGGEEPAFEPVIETLHEAIRSVRARAEDHKNQIDNVLSASDYLLASLRAREQAIA
jgi:predicted transcriptional regulator